jgi:ligand-binding sensor domain-containing protein/class 3 adenylate cyclase
MIRTLTIIIATCLSFISWSQTDFRFRNYSINDGLSQSSVTCIVQDELNSLWIGTQDGLNRFDGRTFEIFVSDKTEGLESSYIRCAELDKNSLIWFGTNNGLTSYDLSKEEFTTYTNKKSSALRITDIYLRKDNTIWIGTEESGLFLFNTETKKFKSWEDAISSRKINKIMQINNEELLVSTGDKGLFILNTNTKTTSLVRLGQSVSQAAQINKIIDHGGEKVFIATGRGVYSLNKKSKKIENEFEEIESKFGPQNVSDIYQHHELGWIIATKGNGLFNIESSESIHHYTADIFQKDALLFDELNEIFRDNSGVIWITNQRGLSSFDPDNRGFLGVGPSGNPTKGIPTPSVWSFTESKDQKYILIGTDYSVTKQDKETGEFKQYHRNREAVNLSKGEMAVLSTFIISDTKALVGCADGLFQLDLSGGASSFTEININRGEGYPSHERVYSIIKWSETSCLMGTKDGVILYDFVSGSKQYFEHSPTNTSESISRGACRLVYKDKKERVWATTSAGGLNILTARDDKLTFRPYEYNSIIRSASKDYITSIFHDSEGNYWLGTFGSGLIKWSEKTKATAVVNKEHGLPNDVIYSVISDNSGRLWMSTNKGLCSYNPKGGKVQSYTEEDGLMSNEFNLGASMRAKDGKLFFGGIYGYNYFVPEELSKKKKDIRVVFTKFKLENEWLKPNKEGSPLTKPIFKTKEINLSYKQRSFTIRFQTSDLSNPEQINYKYVLEGSEEGEIMMGEMNEIHFNALASGTYVLKVFARIGEGDWSKSPATLRIIIAPPFWMTWWFIAIVVASLYVIVRLIIRRRIEASRREQIKLEMKVRTRTKEIQQKNEKIEAQKQKIEEEKNKVVEQQKLLQIEKDKTEKLLKNVIPESTAEELKKRGRARARAYKSVSVLFTDFVGFTKISDRMTATELVKKLDVYFTKFDEIIVKNNLEKIKTIGDAYMCAGGVPVRNRTNAIDTCLAALQIQAYMQKRKNDAIANDQEFWELRLGINTGEVTAGVIGSERLAYDIWGATVNQHLKERHNQRAGG